MPPKPFPFPIGVGSDVCTASRILKILPNGDSTSRWARKNFTRLEWPALWQRFLRTRITATVLNPEKVKEECRAASEEFARRIGEGSIDPSLWDLPRLPPECFKNYQNYYNPNEDRTSPMTLARHLAGRWAAKEAVIKAHTFRQLHMRDISICAADRDGGIRLQKADSQSAKPIALIDPICSIVLMDDRVAKIRGLRGFGHRNSFLLNDLRLSKPRTRLPAPNLQLERRLKIQEHQRQAAEVSITHDGDIAFAVCLASNAGEPSAQLENITDDGNSLPIHEPNWGDEGWLSKDDFIT